RFSAGVCGAAALGGGGCAGNVSCGPLCGAACCGPAESAGAAELADDGGAPVCASATAESQASNDSASKAPRTRSRPADAIGLSALPVLLLCPGVTATPPWPIQTPIADSQTTTRIIAFDRKLGHEIGHQQGQKRCITALKLNQKSRRRISFSGCPCRRVRATWSRQTTPALQPTAPQ